MLVLSHELPTTRALFFSLATAQRSRLNETSSVASGGHFSLVLSSSRSRLGGSLFSRTLVFAKSPLGVTFLSYPRLYKVASGGHFSLVFETTTRNFTAVSLLSYADDVTPALRSHANLTAHVLA